MITLKIDGMACDHCVRAVTRAVRSLAPDARVDIDLEAGSAKIAADSSLDAVPIIAVIEDEGYKVTSVQTG